MIGRFGAKVLARARELRYPLKESSGVRTCAYGAVRFQVDVWRSALRGPVGFQNPATGLTTGFRLRPRTD
jgi:hypothetical protein